MSGEFSILCLSIIALAKMCEYCFKQNRFNFASKSHQALTSSGFVTFLWEFRDFCQRRSQRPLLRPFFCLNYELNEHGVLQNGVIYITSCTGTQRKGNDGIIVLLLYGMSHHHFESARYMMLKGQFLGSDHGAGIKPRFSVHLRHDTASIYRKSRNNRTSRSLLLQAVEDGIFEGCRFFRHPSLSITATHATVRLQILAKLMHASNATFKTRQDIDVETMPMLDLDILHKM